MTKTLLTQLNCFLSASDLSYTTVSPIYYMTARAVCGKKAGALQGADMFICDTTANIASFKEARNLQSSLLIALDRYAFA